MDSPKNPKRLKEGVVSQLYKVVGTNKFKCPDTGELFEKAEFSDADFKWKTDREAWLDRHGFVSGSEIVDGKKLEVRSGNKDNSERKK